MKKLVSLVLAITILLTSVIVVPNKSYAQEDMDYKIYTNQLRRESGKQFVTPEAKFNVYHNGSFKATAIPDGNGRIENIRDLNPGLTAKVGDVIRIDDVSTPGSGNRITKRDLQIGMAHDGTKWQDGFYNYSDSTKSFELKKPGTYVVFLNVADNYSGVSNFENWSELGNWRTIDPPPIKPSGVNIKGWYFTAFKIVVEDSENATSEFEIHHNNKNITNNQSSPEIVSQYPVTVNLKDKSTIESGSISKWEWNIWRNERWEQFSTSQNPIYEVTNPSATFQLKITTTTGKTSISSHKAYFKTGSGTLDVDFDIMHDGVNKTDGNILTKQTSVTLNLKDKTSSLGGTVNNWEWSIYNWNTRNYEVFSTAQNPSRQINFDTAYITSSGETMFTLKAKDSKGNFGQAQHSVNIKQESTLKVSARINAPSYNGQPTGDVDGTFRFTVTSELNDLKSFRIIEGGKYLKGSSTGTLTGKKDEKELAISIPVKQQISISVEVEDIKGNKAIGTATHTIEQNRPPMTSITGPSPLYPRFATQTGEYENRIIWSYSDSDSDEMIGTDYELYKITGDLKEQGENGLSLIKSNSIYTQGMSENEKRLARQITIEGDPGEKFRLIVRVNDGKSSNEEELDGTEKPGEWDHDGNGWKWIKNKTVYRDFTVDLPKPNLELNVPKYQYIRENIPNVISMNFDTYPNKFFKDKIKYEGWSIVEAETNRVVKSGPNKMPDGDIFLEWEVTPTGESLKGGYSENNTYIFKQSASFGALYDYGGGKNYDSTVSKSEQLYIVPVPSPEMWFREIYTIISSDVEVAGYVKQPSVSNHLAYGLPDYMDVFNEKNASYKIINSSNNKVIVDKKGVFSNLIVSKDNGFIDSVDSDIDYIVEHTAINSKGHKTTETSDLTILQTPIPVVSVGTEDTYIDTQISVDPSTIKDNGNISDKKYRDFKDIYDRFQTKYDSSNTSWDIHELDYNFQEVKEVEKGVGIKKTIDVFNPKYEETKFYLLTQWATNTLGMSAYNTSLFAVLTALPPTITVEILERDNDPLTLSNEIYTNETLNIKATIIDSMFKVTNSWWEIINIKDNNIVKNGTGNISGLHKMNLPIGDYKIVQYAMNEKGKIGEGYTTFKVNPILPPVIEVVDTNLIIHSDDNALSMGDNLKIILKVFDINKSEEHPEGYKLSNSYALRNRDNNAVYKEVGVSNIETIIDRTIFKQGMDYNFNQFAQNIEFPNISNTLTMKFKIGNKKPIIDLLITEGDNIAPLFTGENIIMDVTARDPDGTITKVEYFINEIKVKETRSFILNDYIEEGIRTSLYTSKLQYTGNKREDINFKVVATDDFGETDIAEANLYITKPEITTIVKIQNEQNIQKKENRYIEFYLNDSYTNASIYPLNFNVAEIQYQKESGEWITISGDINFNDENIRVHYPKYPNKDTISTYFKKYDNYKLRAIVPNSRGEKGEWGYRNITVEEDLAPIPSFSLISPYHRITESYIDLNNSLSSVVNTKNIGKSFFMFDDKGNSPDNDKIEYKKIEVTYDPLQDGSNLIKSTTNIFEDSSSEYEKDEEIILELGKNKTLLTKDLQDFNITYLTGLDELGNYQFKYTLKEEITQLPEQSNPLYGEIRNLAKVATSEPLNVIVDNIAPILKIEVTGSETVNLIIHFDRQPTTEEEEKIKQIIKDLEKKGIKVNVIKEYGRY